MNVAEAKKLFKSLKNKDFEKKVDDGNKLQYYYLLQTIQAKSSFPEHLSKSGPEFLQKNQPDTALLKKQNTRMWYTQSKVNLLREETEGFSYLMSMLWSDYSFEDISKAMGVFNICFSRVLELMAESLVHKPNTSTRFAVLFNVSPCLSTTISHSNILPWVISVVAQLLARRFVRCQLTSSNIRFGQLLGNGEGGGGLLHTRAPLIKLVSEVVILPKYQHL